MSPSFSLGRGGAAYRYYVSSAVITGRATSADTIRRVPAASIEEFVLSRLRQIDPTVDDALAPRQVLARRIQRISLGSGSVLIEIKFTADQVRDRQNRSAILERVNPDDHVEFDGAVLHLTAPVRMKFRGGRTWLALADGRTISQGPKIDPTLVAALKRGHATLLALGASPQARPGDLIGARGPENHYLGKLCRLAMLAPDIQRAILAGLQPRGVTLRLLMDLEIPLCWADQRAALGFPEA